MSAPGITGLSFHSYTLDVETQLEDGAAAVTTTRAGQVGGSDKVLDFGTITSGPQVEQIAYTPGTVIVDASAADFGNGDESYQFVWQLSDDEDFTAGNVVDKAILPLGEAIGPDADDQAPAAPFRLNFAVDNEFDRTLFRYARLAIVVAGTTPSVTVAAFYVRNVGN